MVLVGEGTLHGELEQMADQLGVRDTVVFSGYAANPFPIMARASALCLPSRYEGFSYVLAEAAALGVPMIASDCAHGPAEILENGRYGELLPPEHPERLAAAMLAHLNDDLPLRRKADDESAYILPELGVQSDGIALPKGIVTGVSVEAQLRKLVRFNTAPNFDRLPIPFRAIATDLGTGEMVVLKDGTLVTAMRASMSVPGGMAPVLIGEGYGDALSPDGKWILAHAGPKLVLLPAGPGEPREIKVVGNFDLGAEWLPDSKKVVIGGALPKAGYRLLLIDTVDESVLPLSPENIWANTIRPFSSALKPS